MTANTEPIFIRSPYLKVVRIGTGSVFPLNHSDLSPGKSLIRVEDAESGALLEDIWYQPLGPISAGFFLRFYITDSILSECSAIAEVPITPISASPFTRVNLAALVFPDVLSPAQTGLSGNKRGLRIPPLSELTVALSADVPSGLAVCVSGGLY